MSKKLKAIVYLFIATLIWGSAFTAQSIGMDYIGPFTFQASRSILAAIFLFPISYVMDTDKPRFRQKWTDPTLWKAGFFCGVCLFLAAGMQQVGLIHTSAGKAGFITTLYIVLVPMLGIFLGHRPPFTAWIGVGLAVFGMFLLSGAGVEPLHYSDILLISCAFFFAVHITLVDRYISRMDGVKLSCVQSLVCAILSICAALLTEQIRMDNLLACTGPILYAGVVSMGIAYTLQIFGQEDVNPTIASLVMSLESVFSALTGWLINSVTFVITGITPS